MASVRACVCEHRAQSNFSHIFTVGLGQLPLHVSWRRQDIE